MWKWAEICIEGYCLIYINYNSCKDPYHYQLLDGRDEEGRIKTEKIPNSRYDPAIEKPIPPEYCPRMVGYTCLENDCPYFGFTECHDECEKYEDDQI
jgi:hypothetical protein